MSDNVVTQNISNITGFYHFTVICGKNNGRVTAFYVHDPIVGKYHVSFSFCSPDDVKIGKFSKSEGRNKAISRFFGINGEEIKRVLLGDRSLSIEKNLKPFEAIRLFLEGMFKGEYLEKVALEYELEEGEVRWIVGQTFSFGSVKVPNWMVRKENSVKLTLPESTML